MIEKIVTINLSDKSQKRLNFVIFHVSEKKFLDSIFISSATLNESDEMSRKSNSSNINKSSKKQSPNEILKKLCEQLDYFFVI